MPERALNIARVAPRTRTNGPGLRAAVWVQGCTLRCRGCFNPETHAHTPGELIAPHALADRLAVGVDGLTLLGGEPFEQAEACADLAERARWHGLSIITYSGYEHAHLRTRPHSGIQRLLAASDVLIAGPYVAARRCPTPELRGSTNQQILRLTDRYRPIDLMPATAPYDIEVWCGGADVEWTGQLAAADLAWLRRLGLPSGNPVEPPGDRQI